MNEAVLNSRSQWMASAFLVGSGVLIIASLFSFNDIHAGVTVFGVRFPIWLFPIYSVVLFSLALCIWLDRFWARWPAAAMLVPLIWTLGSPIFTFNHGQVLGGSGPDANPMAGVVISILGACALVAFVAAVFCLWLLAFHAPTPNDRNA